MKAAAPLTESTHLMLSLLFYYFQSILPSMIVFASEFCLQTLYVLLFQDIHLLHISTKVKVSLNPTVPKTLAWSAWSDRIFSLTVTSQLRTRMRM